MRLGPRLAALLLVGGLGILGLVHEDYYMELGPGVSGYRILGVGTGPGVSSPSKTSRKVGRGQLAWFRSLGTERP